jgi:hypothetical protein
MGRWLAKYVAVCASVRPLEKPPAKASGFR